MTYCTVIHLQMSPCTGMVTVCPLLVVTVAVAMVTTVCPAGMAWEVLRLVVRLVVEGSEGASQDTSTHSRLLAEPVAGQL